jgi:hypothetical protein
LKCQSHRMATKPFSSHAVSFRIVIFLRQFETPHFHSDGCVDASVTYSPFQGTLHLSNHFLAL